MNKDTKDVLKLMWKQSRGIILIAVISLTLYAILYFTLLKDAGK